MSVFDGHFHIFDPAFTLEANEGFLPEPFACAAYLERVRALGVKGGALVAASVQGEDPAFLVAALEQLGRSFVGVAQLATDVDTGTLLTLDRAGVRAVRLNLHRSRGADLDALARLAQRVYDLVGWHAEVYVDAEHLPRLRRWLAGLPRLVIDHLGLSRAGFRDLVELVREGAYVKASGFGRLDFDPIEAIRELYAVAPGRVVFGTDLPSTRAPRPFEARDVELIRGGLPEVLARRVLRDNALALYRRR